MGIMSGGDAGTRSTRIFQLFEELHKGLKLERKLAVVKYRPRRALPMSSSTA